MRQGDTPPDLMQGTASFSREIARGIVKSEVDGGVYLSHLRGGEAIVVETVNRFYRSGVREDAAAYISGHPVFCPDPTQVSIRGSSWGGSMLKVAFVGRG